MRQVKTKTPHGSEVTVTELPDTSLGLRWLRVEGKAPNGHEFLNCKTSFNAAWAMMTALQVFLPEDGAECSLEIVRE